MDILINPENLQFCIPAADGRCGRIRRIRRKPLRDAVKYAGEIKRQPHKNRCHTIQVFYIYAAVHRHAGQAENNHGACQNHKREIDDPPCQRRPIYRRREQSKRQRNKKLYRIPGKA